MTKTQLQKILLSDDPVDEKIKQILALEKKTDLDYSFIQVEKSVTLLKKFVAFRKGIKKPVSSQEQLEAIYSKLKRLSEGKFTYAEKIIENAITAGWQGIFPLDEKDKEEKRIIN